jgi:hypothetical protein
LDKKIIEIKCRGKKILKKEKLRKRIKKKSNKKNKDQNWIKKTK